MQESIVGHPRVMEVADAILMRFCSSYRLGATNAIETRPGADAQDLQADATVYPIRMPGVEWQISAIWALDELTAENGAPTCIPGSHRGDRMRLPDENDTVQVNMPKGSLLLCMGWTLRGWGANRSDASSVVLVSRYSLGWLRSEINHILSVPDAMTDKYPEQVRRLFGYDSYDHGRLGWYPGVID